MTGESPTETCEAAYAPDAAAGAVDSASPSWLKQLLPAASILAVGTLVYANSLHGEFIFDDFSAIRQNLTIRKLWPLGPVLFPSPALMVHGSTVEGRPLLNLSFAVNYAAGEFAVRGYHVVNLALHLLSSLLLLGIVRRTLMLPRFRECIGPSATWLAWMVAMIWMVHPLQTESVSYLSQRAEGLVGLFYLLTMYLAVRSFDSRRPLFWRWSAMATCFLGTGAKEVMVTAPILVCLYDWMFVAGSWSKIWRERKGFYLGMMVLGWGASAMLLASAGSSNLHNVGSFILQLGGYAEGLSSKGHSVHWLDYARAQLWAVPHYLRLCLWPSPLVFDYGRKIARNPWEVLLSAAILVALLAATIAACRRKFWAGYTGAWFFLILAPTSSVIPLSGTLAAEHRTYLPLAGVVTWVVVGSHGLWRQWHSRFVSGSIRSTQIRHAGTALGLLAISVLSGLTMARNKDYRTSTSIWRSVLQKHSPSWQAHHNYATALLGELQVDEALEHFRKALDLDPSVALTYSGIGTALQFQGNFAAAAKSFEHALQLEPHNGSVHKNYADLLMKMGRHGDALYHSCFSLTSKETEKRWDGLVAVAWVLSTSPQDSMRNGSLAIDLARRADKLTHSGNPEVLQILAAAMAEAGQFQEAVETAQRALSLTHQDELSEDIRNQLSFYQRNEPFRDAKGRVRLLPGVSLK